MDIFTKNKLTTLLIVLLLILNISMIGIILFGHFNRPGMRPPGPGPNSDNSFHFMTRELGLSEDQKEKFKQLRKEHFIITRDLNDNMRDIKRKITEELFKDNVDTVKVNRFLIDFGKTHEEFEREVFNHFLALKEACLPHQKQKLQDLMHEIFPIDKRGMDDKHRRPPHLRPPGRSDRKPPLRDGNK
ncbi:MAG: periplasmic heavy metal sensor [Calditrichia bacterium]|nr:periplasmic heavy metal sensor [Calditrichia bacterium]